MNAVVEHKPDRILPATLTPADMLMRAVEMNVDMERLQKFFELHRQWEADQARKAFTAAMARFKAEPVAILKSKLVNIPGGAKFAHATLADVVDAACGALGRHGLSHRWETKQDAGLITVSCIITHESGHSERATLCGAPDDSGRKNSIQQVASTVTYLERYTFMALTGLAAKDMDDDGRSAGNKKPAADAPEGYDNWKADMKALTDDGSERMQSAWQKAGDPLRRFVIKNDDEWWQEMKAKAVQSDKKRKEQQQ